MNSIALLVLLDAFRPDYLWRTEFLRDLARRGGSGAMEEPFGFLPRSAYFGGLTPNDTGYSNIFAREAWRSPFPSIPGFDRVIAAGGESALRTRLVTEARRRLPDFGARYVDGFALPTSALASYAVAESQPPWGPGCPYRSLFHILDEKGVRWVQCSWPYTRSVAAADPGIVASLIDQLTEDTRFGFVHLSQLDAIGHETGPGSHAMQRALEEIDQACALIHARAHEMFDRVRILFFGDHGMVTVVRTVDIEAELREAGLEAGHTFEMFVDSPMARFWFAGPAARDEVIRALGRFEFGRTLTCEDLARYDAHRMQPGNGELFFAAHPGVVFVPNAFQDASTPVRGMHGYLPDVPDNRGLLLSYDSTDRTAGTLGIAQASRIFPTCLHMCDIDPAPYTSLPRLQLTPAPWRWTAAASDGARGGSRTARRPLV
jgi:predicted AlkP superfamily pyrophosphatase or phosphodiesterase